MKNPTEKEIYQSYNEQFKSFQLTWSKYFHYGIFDITSDFISAQQRTIDIISQLAKISSSHLVLDVGCGIGSTCIYLAKTIGCKVYGIDPAVEQIKFAGERSKYENIQSKIDFKEGKAESIPFDKFTFDVVMSNEVFCHLSDKKKGIKECFRVLKKCGYFVFTDLLDFTGGANPQLDYFYSYLKLPSPMGNIDIYRKFLNKTGFNILKIKDFSNEIPRNYKYALSNLESNKEKIVERFGKTEYLNTWNFYSYCLSETIQKNVGWAMFVCKKE